jgi:hypothetical protein
MGHQELIAVEQFAERLKIDFPILLRPKNFSDRIINISNEHLHKMIDLGVKRAKLEFDKQALKEAKHYGN